MGRVLYFHHYFPALMYIVMLGGKGEGEREGGEGRKETERQAGINGGDRETGRD